MSVWAAGLNPRVRVSRDEVRRMREQIEQRQQELSRVSEQVEQLRRKDRIKTIGLEQARAEFRRRDGLLALVSMFVAAPQALENLNAMFMADRLEWWEFEAAVDRVMPFLQEPDPLDEP